MVAFTSLPNETLEYILSLLTPSSLESTRLSCKILNELVVQSPVLQYEAALKAAQAEDNPYSNTGLTPLDKVQALKSRERGWAFLKPDFEMSIPANPLASEIYDLTSGTYVLGNSSRTGISWLKLPQQPGQVEWKELNVGRYILALALCLDEHGLIAFLCPSIEPKCGDLEIILLQLSTGTQHPKAPQSITIPNDFTSNPTVSMEIVGTYIILVLTSPQEISAPFDRVFIYDWTKGTLKSDLRAPRGSWLCVTFLTPTIFLLPNASSSTFDIYYILEDAEQGPPQVICHLALPELREGNHYQLYCRGEPNPIRDRCTFAEVPFRYTSEDAIIVFLLRISTTDDELVGEYFLFLHRRALLQICDAAAFPGVHIPWASWGPPTTRWMDSTPFSTNWITITCGQRAALFSFLTPEAPYTILDFNPENLRKIKARLACLEADFKAGRNDGADLCRIFVIETGEWTSDDVFKHGRVLSSLPYVATCSEKNYEWDGIVLDDQRVIGFLGSGFGPGIKELQVHHFV